MIPSITKEKYEELVLCRKQFLNNYKTDPSTFAQLDREIAASWVRSRSYGVNPCFEGRDIVSPGIMAETIEENSLLIEITRPLFYAFKEKAVYSSYIFGLTDKKGILILSEDNLVEFFSALKPVLGAVSSENILGTNAASLCMMLKRPVQLLGPLNYLELYKDVIGTAVPIFDENEEMIATLTLGQIQEKEPWKTSFLISCSHIMGLLLAMGTAIESKLKLKKSYECLAKAHSTIKTSGRFGRKPAYSFKNIIGESKVFKDTIALAESFAGLQENILLIGESGTGKELFAQAIHNQHRSSGPFIALNCAAIPRELIESELFGYEGGSFTGAERAGRPGKIELAHGGTLFLDEIGDMPFELQAILLRVLEDKKVMRIGGRNYHDIDFRLVAATNKDLYKMVKDKLFRNDLYFRLSTLSIEIPPLRKRGADVEILCQYILGNYCAKLGKKIPQFNTEAQTKIAEYDWPGNVRELENAMIYAVNTSHGDLIQLANLPGSIRSSGKQQLTEAEALCQRINEGLTLKDIEKIAIEKAMARSDNFVPLAASLLDISKSSLYNKLKEYNIKR